MDQEDDIQNSIQTSNLGLQYRRTRQGRTIPSTWVGRGAQSPIHTGGQGCTLPSTAVGRGAHSLLHDWAGAHTPF